mmetsp:Transcript_35940/g.61317  ORF Transcript_35940/g.61317 Transcript_35940/m.61317 type:complete len:266 (+) Transcript_35940:250-1047(+)
MTDASALMAYVFALLPMGSAVSSGVSSNGSGSSAASAEPSVATVVSPAPPSSSVSPSTVPSVESVPPSPSASSPSELIGSSSGLSSPLPWPSPGVCSVCVSLSSASTESSGKSGRPLGSSALKSGFFILFSFMVVPIHSLKTTLSPSSSVQQVVTVSQIPGSPCTATMTCASCSQAFLTCPQPHASRTATFSASTHQSMVQIPSLGSASGQHSKKSLSPDIMHPKDPCKVRWPLLRRLWLLEAETCAMAVMERTCLRYIMMDTIS